MKDIQFLNFHADMGTFNLLKQKIKGLLAHVVSNPSTSLGHSGIKQKESEKLGGPVKMITPQEIREEKDKPFREAVGRLLT